ncbi:MAG: histidine ammonia-lyase [Bacillota bacterium]|nr:histidine ammonia-lyase [Bacillota bacterium]
MSLLSKKPEQIVITGQDLTIESIVGVARQKKEVRLSESARERILKAYQIVKKKTEEKKPVYGITTGFGKLSNIFIDAEQSKNLQKNLIMSHSCGVGKPFEEDVVRSIMLLRANTLAKGYSGVNLKVVETLIEMLNKGVHPVIPEKGSLGASGDLANLAHVALVMIGLGEAEYKGKRYEGAAAMKEAGIETIELEGKDGLGLINGTQIMTALGALRVEEAENLLAIANIAASMTMEALLGLTNALDERIHKVRPHKGQIECAKKMLEILAGSTYVNKAGRVQDAYTLRCVPQVHGASCDAINYVKNVIEIEMNSATDNPLVFPDEGDVISGGNFHGQPLALALDFLGIALSELANISERRIERLVNPQLSGLPPFLAKQSGINSGYMIAQYTAACLVSENKILASPASVDSIPTSANQEDHVSMGAIAARKAGEIVNNLRNVLAIELMCAAQAVEMQPRGKMGKGTAAAYKAIREIIPTLECDRVLYYDINKMSDYLKDGEFVQKVAKALEK